VADEHHQVQADSDDLLRALDELKQLESEKRSADSSTPRFNELAERVEQQARTVMQIAGQQERDGNDAGPTRVSTDEIKVDDATDR